MKKKLPWGEVSFLTVIVLCIAYYFFSVKGYGLKAVLWPYILMAGALLCVLFIAVELVRNASAEAKADQTAAEKKTLGDWFKANSPIFVIIASLLCYALLLKTLGLQPVQLPAELLPCLLPEQGKVENGTDHRRLHHIGILSDL